MDDIEILEALEIPYDSEDGLEMESDEDTDYYQPHEDFIDSDGETNDELPIQELPIDTTTKLDQPGTSSVTIDLQGTSTAMVRPTSNIKPLTSKARNVIWKKGNMVYEEENIQFTGDITLPSDISNLETPLQFFEFFFNDEILDLIVSETHQYSVQCNPNKPVCLDKIDIKRYIGICIIMSIIHIPNVRKYWSSSIGVDVIIDTMTLNTFEMIRRFLHFSNNAEALPQNHPAHDRLFKLRPVVEHLRKRFQLVPREESLSIDEQLCATKARHFLKQYNPMKPHKWGYKIFVLSGISGYAYDFEVYTGQENNAENRTADEHDLGSSSNIVVRLSRCINTNVHHKLYFDNYYTSLPLQVYLEKRGIHSLGTVRRNRLPGVKLPTDVEMKKVHRGYSTECLTTVDNVQLSSTIWKDNKSVLLLSTFVGENPTLSAKRYKKKGKETITVSCPKVVQIYNKHMGGVDLLNSMLGRYKIRMRSRKWYFRLFYHCIDLTVINAWLLWKRVQNKKDSRQKTTLADFREELGISLCKAGSITSSKRGRPKNNPDEPASKRQRASTSFASTTDVRNDQLSHWPQYLVSRQRCKFPGCTGKSFISCEKCNVTLCFNKDKQCFVNYHMK